MQTSHQVYPVTNCYTILRIFLIGMLLMSFLWILPHTSQAAPPNQTEDGIIYIVQVNDTLSYIAQAHYQDAQAWPIIVEATNIKAFEDETFQRIEDPARIVIGQKIWIPTKQQLPNTDTPAIISEDTPFSAELDLGQPANISEDGPILLELDSGGSITAEDESSPDPNLEDDALIPTGQLVVLFGYANKNGEMIIESQFMQAGFFSEGLAAVKIDRQFGYINRSGELMIAPQFDEAGLFNEGLAAVATNGQYGFINLLGKIVIAPQFEQVSDFNDGLAIVQVGDQFGYIDRTGVFAIVPQFERASHFSEGIAVVQVEGQFGYIDQTGAFIVPPEFQKASRFNQGFGLVSTEEEFFVFDKNGQSITDQPFRTIRSHISNIDDPTILPNLSEGQAHILDERPWALDLSNGSRCGFMVEDQIIIDGDQISYTCTDGSYLLGTIRPLNEFVWIVEQVNLSQSSEGVYEITNSEWHAVMTYWVDAWTRDGSTLDDPIDPYGGRPWASPYRRPIPWSFFYSR